MSGQQCLSRFVSFTRPQRLSRSPLHSVATSTIVTPRQRDTMLIRFHSKLLLPFRAEETQTTSRWHIGSRFVRAESESFQKDMAKMPTEVTVFYQKNAWFDFNTCLAYAKAFQESTGVHDEKLLGFDNLTALYTPRFKRCIKLRSKTLLLLIPDNCTNVCAVTDASANRRCTCFWCCGIVD